MLPTVVLAKMRFIHTIIDEMAIQHVGEAGYTRATMEAIADGAGVSNAAVREHITGEYLAQHRAGDVSGRLGEARNV